MNSTCVFLDVYSHYQIEGLHEDIDFSVKVTRDEFEAMCADLFDRIEEPVKQALKMSDITLV